MKYGDFKMRSAINFFQLTALHLVPKTAVKSVVLIVGKLSIICNKFWFEVKSLYNFYMCKQAEGNLTLQVCKGQKM